MPEPGMYTTFATAPDSTHSLIVSLVPPGSRVLEVGCATGYMSEVFTHRLGCSVTGIEIAAGAAALAEPHCERVIVGDVEALDLAALFAGEQFDCIVFGDVLEHLREPEVMLRRVEPLLSSDGTIVASVPNVAHGSVRLALLEGRFDYQNTGLLDRTHLRFFTAETFRELFVTSGYALTHWLRKRVDITRSEIAVSPERISPDLWQHLTDDLDATTYQFIVRAVPSSAVVGRAEDGDAARHDATQAPVFQRTPTEQERLLLKREQWIAQLQREVAERDERIVAVQGEHEAWRAWIGQLQEIIVERDARIVALQDEYEERYTWITTLQSEVSERDARIVALQDEHDERSAWINQLQEIIAERDARIVSLQEEHEAWRTWIDQLQDTIARRDERVVSLQDEHEAWRLWIGQLQRDITQRDAQIDRLLHEVRKQHECLNRYVERATESRR